MDAKGWRSGLTRSVAVGLLGVSTAATVFTARADEARGVSRAAASGISSAALQPGDVPAGYGKPQTKVFTSYVSGMKLGTSTCHVRPPITRSSWRGGLISESRKGSLSQATIQTIDECVFQVTKAAVAHAAYTVGLNQAKKSKGFHRLTVPSVGDESVAYGIGSAGFIAYAIQFRHGAALISLSYFALGKPDLSPSGLAHIASAINGRL
jgi:hypothetical protein